MEVGRSLVRVDAVDKVTGRAKSVTVLLQPGQTIPAGYDVTEMLLLPDEEERGQAVDDHTDSGGDDDRPSPDFRRRQKLPDALRHNHADRDEKNRGIQQ